MAKLNRVPSDSRELNQLQDNLQTVLDELEGDGSGPAQVQLKAGEYRVNGLEKFLFASADAGPITVLLQDPAALTSRSRLTVRKCSGSHAVTVKVIKQGATINGLAETQVPNAVGQLISGALTFVSDGSRYWTI